MVLVPNRQELLILLMFWSRRADLNRGPADYESDVVGGPWAPEVVWHALFLGIRGQA
jgi:hypothetical protein